MDQQENCQPRVIQTIHRLQNDYNSEVSLSSNMTSSVNSNSTSGRGGGVRVAVYLMSDVILIVEIDRGATTQQILDSIESESELGIHRVSSINGQAIFAIWLCSSQLEVQLGPTHKPLELAAKWPRLVLKYGSERVKEDEEPVMYFRRNVFLSRKDEEQIKEPKVLEFLYAEAKHNVLAGRYPCEGQARYASLGALQARVELGPYNPQTHTLAYFRKHRSRFLPHHYNTPSLFFGLSFGLGLGGKGAPEARLLEQYKRIPNHTGTNTNPRKLVRKYLEFCWGLPCYGAAFFQGQIERPVRGLASWITNRDMPVLIAINTIGVHIVDDLTCSLLLGLKYSDLSWEMAKPSDEKNPDCLPCLFLQFPIRENGARVYKILQVFSRQALMMDTLISGFAGENRNNDININATNTNRIQDNIVISNIGNFTNKLSKFTLATFDDEGHCIGQMGSWSFQ